MASKEQNWLLNSDINPLHPQNQEKKMSQKIILEQRKKGMWNTLYERANEIKDSIEINIKSS